MGFLELSSKFLEDSIITESNRCVSCGLCLPHCPTYRLLKSEADSPRGRIALMNGVASGRIPLNQNFTQHMDRCLTCRACEAVCPNQVAYGHLIDETRALIADQSKSFISGHGSNIKILLRMQLLVKPARLEWARRLFYLLQKNGLLQWLLKFRLLEKNKLFKMIAQLPRIKFPYAITTDSARTVNNTWEEVYPAKGEERGKVGLFLGCVARMTDVATLNSSIYVLNCLGYTVYVPPDQTCCGALHQHSGELRQAAALSKQNESAFAALDISAIITTASGCGAQLFESRATDGHNKIIDISRFLVAAQGWANIEIAPLPQRILVHDPCSLRNVMGGSAYPYELISRIPDVQVVPLAGNDQCCGAAGTYFIDQPEIAGMLLNDKISAVIESGAQYLVTSNIGCAMYIANGLYEKKINVDVLHPVTLLARQMGLEL
jgi:glycolate oxidase iron-sulfur subunit